MKKDQSIETIRGLALILMVAGHVIGQNESGMRVADDSIWSYIYFSLMFIRMPLYTVISGYVYSLRPVQRESWDKFLKNKLRRLIVPLIFVATIQYLFQSFIPSVNTPKDIEQIWRIYLFSYSHFWYLQALLVIFALIILLDYYKLLERFGIWLLALGIASIFFLFPISTKFFSLQQVSYLLPFFLLGYGLSKFESFEIKKKPIVVTIIFLVFISSFIIQQFTWFWNTDISTRRVSPLSIIVGLSSTTLFVLFRKEVKWLAYIGKYSYTVYLWHVFATAGSRIFLEYIINIKENLGLTFFVGLFFGAILPIFFEKLIERNRLLSFLCLGSKLKKNN